MDIHKPKPVHTWREFASEIIVIVIGISIALGAEQVVEGFRQRHQVEQDKVILAKELASDLSNGIVRMRTSACVDARLNELSVALDRADRSGVLPPMPAPGRPRNLTFSTAGWDNVVASQSATHFPRDQLHALQYVYNIMNYDARLSDDENRVWSTIYTMVGPGRRLGAGEAQSLREALVNARTINLEIATLAVRLTEQLKALNLDFDADERAKIRKVLTMPMAAVDTRGACEPVSKVIPPNYGQSPWSQLLPEGAEAVKTLRTEF